MTLHHEHHFSRSHCPVGQLEWFVNQTLPASERATVEAHLTGCAACRAEVGVWIELRQVMQDVSTRTPEPRADLFMQIERQLDVLPSPAPLIWLSSLLQACWFALTVCGEHFRAQARLIRRDLFWMPLFILPLVCTIVYLPQSWPQAPGAAALIAALLTALSIAFLYSQEVDPAREMTLVTLTSPRLVLGVRCGLVFGYDLLLNCGLVLPFLALHGIVTPVWFLANWLAPLCCLSAIALLLSILVNSGTAVFVCALLWALRMLNSVQTILFGGSQPLTEAPGLQQYERFWHQEPLLFVVASLAVLLTFIVLERKERFVR